MKKLLVILFAIGFVAQTFGLRVSAMEKCPSGWKTDKNTGKCIPQTAEV